MSWLLFVWCLHRYWSAVCIGEGAAVTGREVGVGRWCDLVWHQSGCCQGLTEKHSLLFSSGFSQFASFYLEKSIYAAERMLKALMIFVPEIMRLLLRQSHRALIIW